MNPLPGEPAFRIDGRAVAEADFYAAACDPQRSVVVEACAGAGKTWMLVSRMLRALLDGTEPQQILAITYTRRAAGEMRARLDEWLQIYSDVRCKPEVREQALRDRGVASADAPAQAVRLGGLHERLLRGGRAVEVQTFHGWFAQLLSNAPMAFTESLRLPSAYELIEDVSVMQDELFRAFHRAVDADASLRSDYIGLVSRHRRGSVQQWLQAAWQRGAELARADRARAAEGAVPDAATCWPECRGLADAGELLLRPPLRDEVAALATRLGAGGKAQANAADRLEQALAAKDGAGAFERAWQALYTAGGEPRSLGNLALQARVCDALQRLRAMRVQQRAHEDHGAMLRLARVLRAQYAELKRRRGLVDMADLERAAEALLGDSVASGWVQERLDQRLRQVLIDEFQDTNPMQWQVLHGWLAAYAGAGGGASGQRPPALFIVGDPKQSIYRFRGAEPRVFGAARDFVCQALNGLRLECDHTRRCAPELVQALNAVFGDARRLDGWEPFRAHTTAAARAGILRRLPGVAQPPAATQAARDPEAWRDSLTQPRREPEVQRRVEEAAQAAAAVAALIDREGVAPRDIMVLARKRAALALVADALAAAGIAHVVAEPLALHESPEALDLAAVLDVLASPGHDLSLARALKSPIFGADDDDLLWLARASRAERHWRAALFGAPVLPTPALQRARRLLSDWAARADSLPPHDLLDRVVHEAEVLSRYAAAVPPARRAAALHAVHALLTAALAQQGGRHLSLYRFVRELRAGRLKADAAAPADAVQLLTVHGAKGLEARAVVIVDADPADRPRDRATLLVDWPVEQAAPRRAAFVLDAAALPSTLSDLWAAELESAAREEINALYVAMTRASERLVFSRTEPRRGAMGRSWWQRIEGHALAWTPAASGSGAPAQAAVAEVPMLPSLRSRPAPGHARVAAEDVSAASLGQAVHRALEWCGQPGPAWPPREVIAACVAAAQVFGLPAGDAARVRQIVEGILGSADCARFYAGATMRWAGNEVPVADGGELLRIDRLVALDEGDGVTWWVLDYKLHSAPHEVAAYRAQLRRYVGAVRRLQPEDAVRGAFITSGGTLVAD